MATLSPPYENYLELNPDEILTKIFHFVDARSLGRLARTNKNIHRITSDVLKIKENDWLWNKVISNNYKLIFEESNEDWSNTKYGSRSQYSYKEEPIGFGTTIPGIVAKEIFQFAYEFFIPNQEYNIDQIYDICEGVVINIIHRTDNQIRITYMASDHHNEPQHTDLITIVPNKKLLFTKLRLPNIYTSVKDESQVYIIAEVPIRNGFFHMYLIQYKNETNKFKIMINIDFMEEYLGVDFDCIGVYDKYKFPEYYDDAKYKIGEKIFTDIDNQVKEKIKQLLPEIRELFERYIQELATEHEYCEEHIFELE